jgi:predicted DNA repair protein MutK
LSAGLAALLDDVAVLARAAAASVDDVGVAAAKAGAKAAGVVIDDAAVTPQYVRGLAAERELPIVRRIALGSLRNKFLIILPVILVLSQFLPGLLTPLLMLGGAYLCYEGAEKVWERIAHHDEHGEAEQQPDEKTLVAGAIRTDLILSAEIMVISLNEVASETFVSRLLILSVVAVIMTVLVYGAVGLIVKMDDVGLRLAERDSKSSARLGRGLVKAMPKVLTALSVIGTAAMLWVGGHILLVGMDELGVHFLYEFVHHMEEAAHDATGAVGGVVGWLVNTVASAILGLIVGAVVVAVMSVTFHRKKSHGSDEHKAAATPEAASALKSQPGDATQVETASTVKTGPVAATTPEIASATAETPSPAATKTEAGGTSATEVATPIAAAAEVETPNPAATKTEAGDTPATEVEAPNAAAAKSQAEGTPATQVETVGETTSGTEVKRPAKSDDAEH